MELLIGHVLAIISTASVFALVAAGFAASFRLMGIINLAHGEFLMIGAYTTVVLLKLQFWFPVAVVGAVLVGCVLGGMMELVLIRRLYNRLELAILATFGLGLIIRQSIEIVFGKGYQSFANPLPGSASILGAEFPIYRLVLVLAVTVILGGSLYALNATRLGIRIRAVASDDGLSESLGIRSRRLKLLVFAISTGLASLAGALIAPITNVAPGMGVDLLFIAFVVVIVGGSRLHMVIAAAVVVAAVQNLTTIAVDSLAAKIAVLIVAAAVLLWTRRVPGSVTV